MQKKGIIQIYREGWTVILKALFLGLAVWVVAIPFRFLEYLEETAPEWALVTIAALMVFIYLPFAAYFVYHASIDFGKTEHKFTPLIERISKKRIQNEE